MSSKRASMDRKMQKRFERSARWSIGEGKQVQVRYPEKAFLNP
jgi:hypothetical protein